MFPYYSDTPSPPPAWDGGLMYYQSNPNPYDSELFLNQTFNFNQQSIAAFQTLSHQLKLKFYLSVEEVKMLGHMNDRQGYQNILQEIARRRMIIKKPEVKKENQKNQAEQWGAKLENLCEDHLKKMQRDNFLEDLPIGYYDSHSTNTQNIDLITDENVTFPESKTGNIDEQFDWVEPNTVQQTHTNNLDSSQNTIPFQPLDYGNGLHVQTKQNKQENHSNIYPTEKDQDEQFDDFVEANTQNYQKSQSSPGMENSLFSADKSGLISSNQTQPPPPPPPQRQQHIDIWDLQVIEEDPDKLKRIILNKASISQSSQSKQSQHREPSLTKTSSIQKPSSNKEFQISQQLNLIQQANDMVNKSASSAVASFRIIGDNTSDPIQNNLFPLETFFFGEAKPIQADQAEVKPILDNEEKSCQNRAETQNSTKRNDQDQFQWQQNGKNDELETVNPVIIVTHETNKVYNNQLKTHHFRYGDQFNFPSTSQQQYQNIYSDRTHQPIQIQQSTAKDIKHLNVSTPPAETSFATGLNGFDNSIYLGDSSYQNQGNEQVSYDQAMRFDYFKKNQQENQIQSSMLASYFLPSVDTQILDTLKRFPPTENIVFALKKKGFDFDRTFYKEAQNLISNLGYEHNPDYEYLHQQGKICDQIFRLTEAYTAAVDQDKENEIKENLKTCKTLYSKLDTTKTVSTVKKYLKMQGRSLSHQIGRLSLEAGVPKQLIAKVVNDSRFNQIATMFYLMVFFGSIYSTSTLACQVIDYMEQMYDEIQKLGQQISEMPVPCRKIIKQNGRFLMYRQNLGQISTLIRRFVMLGTLSSKDQLYYDMSSIQQKIDSLPHQKEVQKQIELIPNYFVTFFSQLASSKCNNLYTLHQQMKQFIDEHPLCALCLECLQSDRHDECGGAKRDDSKFYHFRCWNFKNEVEKFKRQQMNSSGAG